MQPLTIKHFNMKRNISLIFVLVCLTATMAFSQTKKPYTTSGGEMIFSFAVIDDDGSESGNVMRWTPFFNLQNLVNYDVNNSFGLFSGINIRNVGFIYDNYTDKVSGDVVKKKFRNYTLGIPVGLKIGKLDKSFFYGGYEIEFPINYKEKTFQNEQKDKFSVWFSGRVPVVYHTILAGIQFPHGMNLKFKYYLTSFHNKNFEEKVNGNIVKPYENLNSNIFYISLNFDLFKNYNLEPPDFDNKKETSAFAY